MKATAFNSLRRVSIQHAPHRSISIKHDWCAPDSAVISSGNLPLLHSALLAMTKKRLSNHYMSAVIWHHDSSYCSEFLFTFLWVNFETECWSQLGYYSHDFSPQSHLGLSLLVLAPEALSISSRSSITDRQSGFKGHGMLLNRRRHVFYFIFCLHVYNGPLSIAKDVLRWKWKFPSRSWSSIGIICPASNYMER